MQKKIEICKQCFISRPVNSKSLCKECVFKNNHNGKSQFEVYNERSKLNQSIKADNLYVQTIKPLKKAKNKVKVSSDKLERRRLVIEEDEKLYEYIFNAREPRCEECGKQLPDQFRDDEGNIIYRAQYSHILSKGAFPEFRHIPKNINRLCLEHHSQWEFGKRDEMKIFQGNQITVQQLYDEKNKVEI